MVSSILYCYIRKLLNESGIDFLSIEKNDILAACKSYDGLSEENYEIVIKVINDIYDTR
jgi:hypothetical protein